MKKLEKIEDLLRIMGCIAKDISGIAQYNNFNLLHLSVKMIREVICYCYAAGYNDSIYHNTTNPEKAFKQRFNGSSWFEPDLKDEGNIKQFISQNTNYCESNLLIKESFINEIMKDLEKSSTIVNSSDKKMILGIHEKIKKVMEKITGDECE